MLLPIWACETAGIRQVARRRAICGSAVASIVAAVALFALAVLSIAMQWVLPDALKLVAGTFLALGFPMVNAGLVIWAYAARSGAGPQGFPIQPAALKELSSSDSLFARPENADRMCEYGSSAVFEIGHKMGSTDKQP